MGSDPDGRRMMIGVQEPAERPARDRWRIHPRDLRLLGATFWWAIVIAGILSLARFSPAFLVLKAHDVHVEAAYVPIILVVMNLIYSAAAYPFGTLADRIDRRAQLAFAQLAFGGGSVLAAMATLMLLVPFPMGRSQPS
ncbi:MAG: hypothetical protein IT537_24915 [Hyphomicrobiales bacterium]|nr:hypothetical protein [Hyphomicrobiales bacterium]